MGGIEDRLAKILDYYRINRKNLNTEEYKTKFTFIAKNFEVYYVGKTKSSESTESTKIKGRTGRTK